MTISSFMMSERQPLRFRHRLRRLAGAGGLQLLTPVLGVASSIIVTRGIGGAGWGSVVHEMLVIGLAAHLVGWGARDFVLRETAASPTDARLIWRRNTLSRLTFLLPPALVAVALAAPDPAAGPAGRLLPMLWCVAMVWCRSFDAPMVQGSRYGQVLAVDLLAAGLSAAGLITVIRSGAADTTTASLVGVLAGAEILRALGRTVIFRHLFTAPGDGWRPVLADLRAGRGFFLLGFSGLLASRADSYAVGLTLPPETLGHYQIVTTFVIHLQTLGAVWLMTATPDLLRLPRPAVLRFTRRNFVAGIALMATAAMVLPVLVPALFGFTPATALVLAATAAGTLTFLYGPLLLLAQRQGRELQVAASGFAAGGLTFAGGLLLAPSYGPASVQIALATGHLLQLAIAWHAGGRAS
ncbi:hypothetical protein P7L79_22960 [Tistrella mobilis]|uniref:hypothetical protein n=1 Tax=Tistrella mobilis TaxID=171437 RepID=UPI003557C938